MATSSYFLGIFRNLHPQMAAFSYFLSTFRNLQLQIAAFSYFLYMQAAQKMVLTEI
jgi:hypothetical protein